MCGSDWNYAQWTEQKYEQINQELSKMDGVEVIKWAYEKLGDDLVYACSFGAEGMVLIDLISKVRKNARIVFLDTHLHFQETYKLIERVKQKYPGLKIETVQPELTLEEQKDIYGNELWKRNPDLCCQLRKIVPLEKVLSGARAWISGLRREQSPIRAATQYVNRDDRFKSIKICPLIHWSWNDIWNYIRIFQLPYNELHDHHYPSIGCEKCTRPVKSGEDSRAGRWSSSDKTECGLHTS